MHDLYGESTNKTSGDNWKRFYGTITLVITVKVILLS
jgi:hypothetical protein